MRDVTISKLVGRSVERTQDILFRPFALKKWVKLLFIAWIAGSLVNCSGNGGGGGGNRQTSDVKPAQSVSQPAPASEAPGGASAAESAPAQTQSAQSQAPQSPRAAAKEVFGAAAIFFKSPAGMAIAAAIFLFGAAFFLFWMWLSARFKFVWFDSIARNHSNVSEPYRRFSPQGNSLFRASVCIMALSLAIIAGLIAWGYFVGKHLGAWQPGFDWSFRAGLNIFAGPIGGLLILMIIGGLFHVAIEHFVVPVMAANQTTFLSALSRFFQIFKTKPTDFILYLFVIIGLGIALGILSFIAAIAFLLVCLLVSVIVFGLLYLVIAALLKATWLFGAIAFTLAVPFLLVVLFVLSGIGLVSAVFFRSFANEFLFSQKSPHFPASAEEYVSKNPPGTNREVPWAPFIAMFLLVFLVFGGIVSAIAIPNFIAARNAALAQKQ